GAFAFDERLGAASIVDHGFDLAAVADDALVGEEALDVACGEPRDAVEIEVVEGGAEVLALGEDRAPAEARLKSLEAELLEQATVVAHGVAPFVVVIGDVLRRGAAPPAALQAVGTRDRRGHDRFNPAGNAAAPPPWKVRAR